MNRREILQAGAAALATSLLRPAMLTGAPPAVFSGLAQAKPPAPGPFQPTWESIRDGYRAPSWFRPAKFGIFVHWGLYAVPAHHNEWYARHMYTDDVDWHTQHYGPPDVFGYKDFIPLFKAEKYEPAAWAALFKEAGARYVVPVAEHHDGFAMWDSDLTRWCAGNVGPKRDLIGDLAAAVRAQGLVFGLSSHRMEHHTFMYPKAGVKNDQFDPRYADFYGPPVPGEMNDSNASPEFQEDWLARCQELIDKYRPQIFYFDNGVNDRSYDAIKLRLAAYYYNRALERKLESTVAAKDVAFLAGSVGDFEKAIRAPRWIYPAAFEVDDTISTGSWGYTTDLRYRSADSILQELVDIVSKGGNLLLNISPRADGTIPDEQQDILRTVGAWLRTNGDAIYESEPWTRYGEGPSVPPEPPPDWRGGSSANPRAALPLRRAVPPTSAELRFTTHRGALYVIGLVWPEDAVVVRSLAAGAARVERVTLLGGSELRFVQSDDGLRVDLPEQRPGSSPFVLRIDGLRRLGQF